MDSGYRIDLASTAHIAAIPAIERAAATLFSNCDVPEELRARVTDTDILVDAQREGRLWVGLDRRGAPVGFALAEMLVNEPFLDEVDVMPQHGRRGLGTRLVRTVADWAALQRYPALMLLTFRHLPWNAPFYASLGFTELSENEISATVRERLQIEAAAGLDVRKRVAMRLSLNGI